MSEIIGCEITGKWKKRCEDCLWHLNDYMCRKDRNSTGASFVRFKSRENTGIPLKQSKLEGV